MEIIFHLFPLEAFFRDYALDFTVSVGSQHWESHASSSARTIQATEASHLWAVLEASWETAPFYQSMSPPISISLWFLKDDRIEYSLSLYTPQRQWR